MYFGLRAYGFAAVSLGSMTLSKRLGSKVRISVFRVLSPGVDSHEALTNVSREAQG